MDSELKREDGTEPNVGLMHADLTRMPTKFRRGEQSFVGICIIIILTPCTRYSYVKIMPSRTGAKRFF